MNVQKVNYQKELEKLLKQLGEEQRVPSSDPQLLCTMQQLCARISVGVFYDNDILL